MKKNTKRSTEVIGSRGVLLIIPAFNEEAAINNVINSIPHTVVISKIQYKTSIIVIDDCSTDKTYETAIKTRARVLHHIINMGAGAATRTGFAYALKHAEEFSYVITIDADGQHNTNDIKT